MTHSDLAKLLRQAARTSSMSPRQISVNEVRAQLLLSNLSRLSNSELNKPLVALGIDYELLRLRNGPISRFIDAALNPESSNESKSEITTYLKFGRRPEASSRNGKFLISCAQGAFSLVDSYSTEFDGVLGEFEELFVAPNASLLSGLLGSAYRESNWIDLIAHSNSIRIKHALHRGPVSVNREESFDDWARVAQDHIFRIKANYLS